MVVAYVSRMNINIAVVATLDYRYVRISSRCAVALLRKACLTAIAKTQKIHLQPFAWERKPPTTGPKTEPRSIPSTYNAIATPRLSGWITSATVPPPRVRGDDPAQPAINRNPIRAERLGLTAQEIVKATKRMLQMW